MAAVEDIRAAEQLATVAAKLDIERKANKSISDELNRLRLRVNELEDASIVEKLKLQIDALTVELTQAVEKLKASEAVAAKASRDLQFAGPALALVEALRAVKA